MTTTPAVNPDLVDAIYEGALAPERWPMALDRLVDMAGGKGAVTFVVEPDVTRWTATEGVFEAMVEFIGDGWVRRNSRVDNAMRLGYNGVHRFITERELYPDGEHHSDPLYTDFFRPRGMGLSLGSALVMPHGDLVVISIERPDSRGPFSEAAVATMTALYGDIQRAAMIAGRLAFERVSGAVEALERLGLPCVAVDSACRVLATGQNWDRHAPFWTTRGGDRLALIDRRADQQLREALIGPDGVSQSQSLVLTDATGAQRAILHVMPVRRSARDIFTRGAAVLTLSLPQTGVLCAAPLVQALLDLTPAEADVALQLANGASPKDIARAGGKSVETVRSQIKSVMRKTGCKRASQLMLLVNQVAVAQTPMIARD